MNIFRDDLTDISAKNKPLDSSTAVLTRVDVGSTLCAAQLGYLPTNQLGDTALQSCIVYHIHILWYQSCTVTFVPLFVTPKKHFMG